MPMRPEDVEIAYRSLCDRDSLAWSGEISPAVPPINWVKEVLIKIFGPEVTRMSLEQVIKELKGSELLI